jgi:hypothetical protein
MEGSFLNQGLNFSIMDAFILFPNPESFHIIIYAVLPFIVCQVIFEFTPKRITGIGLNVNTMDAVFLKKKYCTLVKKFRRKSNHGIFSYTPKEQCGVQEALKIFISFSGMGPFIHFFLLYTSPA